MIYGMIHKGVILNLDNEIKRKVDYDGIESKWKVDYDRIKTETLLCIIYMRFIDGNYSHEKMRYFFKRLSQYHSFAKLVDQDLSSIIQRYFSNITIAGAEFRRINLKHYNFNGSKLYTTKFIQCKLESASIRDIKCKDTTFDMCLISKIKDGNATVSGSITFKGCKLNNVVIIVNKADTGTELFFEECVIDNVRVSSQSGVHGMKVHTSFKDCIIRQCSIEVDNLSLSIQRAILDSRIKIACVDLRYNLGPNEKLSRLANVNSKNEPKPILI